MNLEEWSEKIAMECLATHANALTACRTAYQQKMVMESATRQIHLLLKKLMEDFRIKLE